MFVCFILSEVNGKVTHAIKHTRTMASGCLQGCGAGGVSLVLKHWKPRCSCSQGVPSFCMWAGMALNDGRLGGGREGWWLMCRQRGSLLCVSEAHKAASVCGGTERQDAAAQTQCGGLFSSRTQNYFLCFLSISVLMLSHPPSALRIQQPSVWRYNLV